MLEKVLSLQDKYQSLQDQLSSPDVMSDMKKFVQLNKDYKELEPIIKAGLEYKMMLDELASAKDILMNEKDEDLREMAKEEVAEIEPKLPEMEQNIKLLLIPADPDDSKNAIVEIRGGTGGDEAAIFAGDLFRMYSKYAESKGWRVEVTDQTPGTSGGFKQIVFKLSSSEGVYGTMKYESGVHRVQRVPQTETQGRIQTSAASVAVFPEALDVDAMDRAGRLLVGEHDFAAFCSRAKTKKSTLREIDAICVKRDGNEIRITVTADGFLYNMMRIIAGTLIEAGRGERSPESISALFTAQRDKAGFLAPPQGLCLMEVEY